jgi:hypothetical protein
VEPGAASSDTDVRVERIASTGRYTVTPSHDHIEGRCASKPAADNMSARLSPVVKSTPAHLEERKPLHQIGSTPGERIETPSGAMNWCAARPIAVMTAV